MAPGSWPPWPASMAMTSGRMPRPRIRSFIVLTASAGGALASVGAVAAPLAFAAVGAAGTPVAIRVGTPVATVVAAVPMLALDGCLGDVGMHRRRSGRRHRQLGVGARRLDARHARPARRSGASSPAFEAATTSIRAARCRSRRWRRQVLRAVDASASACSRAGVTACWSGGVLAIARPFQHQPRTARALLEARLEHRDRLGQVEDDAGRARVGLAGAHRLDHAGAGRQAEPGRSWVAGRSTTRRSGSARLMTLNSADVVQRDLGAGAGGAGFKAASP